MKIAIDIDNVVADLYKGFCDFYKIYHGREIKISELEGYYLCSILPISKEDETLLWQEYWKSEMFDDMELIEGSKEAIDLLIKQDEIFFVTARNKDWKIKTFNFFKKHFPGNNFNILFSGDIYGGKLKEEICKDLGISLIIEDHSENSLRYALSGLKVFLLDKPWNKNVKHENIHRCKDWGEIVKKIKNLSGEKVGQ